MRSVKGTHADDAGYSGVAQVEINAGDFGHASTRSDKASLIQSAIDEAVAISAVRVYIPERLTNYDAGSVTFNDSVRMVREGQHHEYDVKAYGAAGDGPNGTDDLNAIDEAASAADSNNHDRVWHPPGTYTVSTDPTFPGDTDPVGVSASYDGSATTINDYVGTDEIDSDQIATDAVGTDEIDQSISPTWTGLHTFNGNLRAEDDDQIQLGDAPDYWWEYESASTRLRLRSSDIDGGGTDGDIARVPDGRQVMEFVDDVLFAGLGFRARVESIAMFAVEDLEEELNQVTTGFGSSRRLGVNTDAYSISNDSTDRTFDANSTTTAELADVLATLIRDLGRDS